MKKKINKNCWLVRNLDESPAERCKYCQLKFHNCLFFQYLLISFSLATFFMIISHFWKGEISRLLIITLFTLILVYGYFFNKSTTQIVKAGFEQKKANKKLKDLSENLQEKVDQQTKKIRKAYENLKELDKAKSEFLSIASHQLRTPLTAIKGYVSMILEEKYGKINKTIKEKLERVDFSVERLNSLVSTLLSVSRIEKGKMKLECKNKNLNKIVSNIVNEFRVTAKKKNIYLRYEKPKKKIPKVCLDKKKITEVISNIIDNAVKYTEKGGITVKMKKKNYLVLIKVSDTGQGMTKKEMKKLFTSFIRGSEGKRLYTEGTGLGLYISKKFVDLHNGKIWAESKGKGKGSNFYVELPIKRS